MAADLTWGASWLPPTSWHRSSVGAWQAPRSYPGGRIRDRLGRIEDAMYTIALLALSRWDG